MLLRTLVIAAWLVASTVAAGVAAVPGSGCSDDAMFVFDASGSMSGVDYNGGGTRMDRVRAALGAAIPEIAQTRNLGLMSYGPGSGDQCDTITLHFRPKPNAAAELLGEVAALAPAGRTPLTEAVRQAALLLAPSRQPAAIVLLTDGGETCSGQPCQLSRILKRDQPQLTVHVVGFRLRDEQGKLGYFAAKCLADATGGMFLATETTDELVAGLRQAFGCPALSRGGGVPRGRAG